MNVFELIDAGDVSTSLVNDEGKTPADLAGADTRELCAEV